MLSNINLLKLEMNKWMQTGKRKKNAKKTSTITATTIKRDKMKCSHVSTYTNFKIDCFSFRR